MKICAALLLFLMGPLALSAEIGTGFVSHMARYNIAEQGHGLDLRINFYGARWSVGIGHVPERRLDVDKFVKTPAGIQQVSGAKSYSYLSLDRRFYFDPFENKRVEFWAAFGFMYRDVETCLLDGRCYGGSVEVSERVCFHPGFGMRWRRIEIAYEHCSTADIARVNQGEDFFRFNFLWNVELR